MIRFAIPPIGGKGWFGGWMYMQNLVRALSAGDNPDIETLLFVGPDRSSQPEIRALAKLPSLDALRGRLIGLIQAPATKLAVLMQTPARNMVGVTKAYGEKV